MTDSAQKTGRDKRGRFLAGNPYRWEKGVCPNPKGRPTTAHLLGLLRELVSHSRVGADLERVLDETVRVRVDASTKPVFDEESGTAAERIRTSTGNCPLDPKCRDHPCARPRNALLSALGRLHVTDVLNTTDFHARCRVTVA